MHMCPSILGDDQVHTFPGNADQLGAERALSAQQARVAGRTPASRQAVLLASQNFHKEAILLQVHLSGCS